MKTTFLRYKLLQLLGFFFPCCGRGLCTLQVSDITGEALEHLHWWRKGHWRDGQLMQAEIFFLVFFPEDLYKCYRQWAVNLMASHCSIESWGWIHLPPFSTAPSVLCCIHLSASSGTGFLTMWKELDGLSFRFVASERSQRTSLGGTELQPPVKEGLCCSHHSPHWADWGVWHPVRGKSPHWTIYMLCICCYYLPMQHFP